MNNSNSDLSDTDSDNSSLSDGNVFPENFNFINDANLKSKFDRSSKVFTVNSNIPRIYAYHTPFLQQVINTTYFQDYVQMPILLLFQERQIPNDLIEEEDFCIYVTNNDENADLAEDFSQNPAKAVICRQIILQYLEDYLPNLEIGYFQTKLNQIKKQLQRPQQQQVKPMYNPKKTISKERVYNAYTNQQILNVSNRIQLGQRYKQISLETQVKVSTIKKIASKLRNDEPTRQPKINNNCYLQIPEEFRQQILNLSLNTNRKTDSIKRKTSYFNNMFNLNNNEKQYRSIFLKAGFTYRKGTNHNIGIWENQEHDLTVKQVSIRILDYLNKGFDIVAVDETGLNSSCQKMYGWDLGGRGTIPLVRPYQFYNKSFCVGISFKYGFIAGQVKEKGFDSAYFNHFLQKMIQKYQQMSQYMQDYVILMDNASIHKTQHVIQMLNERNVNVIFNATYNPKQNPIEEFFGVFKQKLRSGFDTNQEDIVEDSFEALLDITNETIRKCYLNSFLYSYFRLFQNE